MRSLETTDAQVSLMPLHEITGTMGTEGLIQRLGLEVATFSEAEQHQLNQAFFLAYELHKDDERSTEPYMNHILRVALRIKSHYGVTDADIITGALLHDAIEDHTPELLKLAGLDADDKKQAALVVLSSWFNPRVASMVDGVTNPEFDDSQDMKLQYLEHLHHLVAGPNADSIVLKLSDFTDNATGIHYSSGPKLQHWASKYLPVIPILRSGLERTDLPLSDAAKAHIHAQLAQTERRIYTILSHGTP